jgi:3-dehydroquinate synthase
VDSSVGGKTGINSPAGKNLIGAFYQPSLVLADTAVLDTLPARQMKAGYAEILKYGLIDDPAFFDWLEQNGAAVLQREPSALQYAIEKSCTAKARVVASDETEQGRRALLNLGHSFGHALEVEAGYDGSLLHGEAVAIGMDMALALSVQLGFCPAADLARLRAHYDAIDLWPDTRPALSAGRMLTHMAKDKKNQRDQIVLILSHGIGKAFVDKNIPAAVLKEFLENYLKPVEDRAHGN